MLLLLLIVYVFAVLFAQAATWLNLALGMLQQTYGFVQASLSHSIHNDHMCDVSGWIFRCFWFYSGFVQMNHETGPNVKTRNFIDRIIFAKINKITYMVALWLLLYWLRLSTWNWASARFWLGQSCHSFGIDKRILLYVHFAFAPFWLLHCSFGCLCQCNVKLFHSCHLQDLVKSFSFGWVGQILL